MSASRDLDDASMVRLARSFYLVKMVRYAALLVAVLAIAALAAARDAPTWVPATLVVVAAAFVAGMLLTRRRYLRRRPPASASSPSPTG